MKRIALICLSLAVTVLPLVSGCSSKTSNSADKNGGEIIVYNWGEYIDEDVLTMFEEETGTKVTYKTFATNEELYALLKGGGASCDVIIPSDYMVSRMAEENLIQKLDFEKIPNYALVRDDLKKLDYDPSGEYSVPYMWGIVGIIYNKTMVDDVVDSWDILWNEKYAKQILMFDNSRDAIGISLKRLGYSYNTTNPEEISAAVEELKKQKPLVSAYVMDQIFNKMEGNEAALAPYYAGDAVTMIEENPDLAFAVPKEGTNYFVDAMCIPASAKNTDGAMKFIDFMTRPDVSAKNAEYIYYSTPVTKAWEMLPDELKNNPIAYPSTENTEVFKNLPRETLELYDSEWVKLMSN